jgi:hypothetical protein
VSGSPHIPYPRFQAALHARDLAFILRHSPRITMGLPDEIEVCRLIAAQRAERLDPASAQWLLRFAEQLAVSAITTGPGR